MSKEQQNFSTHETSNEIKTNIEQRLTPDQSRLIKGIVGGFDQEKHDDGSKRWEIPFKHGAKDNDGAIWLICKDEERESGTWGWQIYRYVPAEEEVGDIDPFKDIKEEGIRGNFHWVSINNLTRMNFANGGKSITTYQFDIGHEKNQKQGLLSNDVLNLVEEGDGESWLNFWNQDMRMHEMSKSIAVELGSKATAGSSVENADARESVAA